VRAHQHTVAEECHNATDVTAHCPACSSDIDDFVPGLRGRARAKCPNCDALERHRLFALVLAAWAPAIAEARTVLDIAPHGPTRRAIRHIGRARYIGFDLEGRVEPDVIGSITELPFADATFDVVICMHVLEHIADDARAIDELHRVLSSTGTAFVQVPRRPGHPTEENPAAPVHERIARFGQADHVRLYGDDFEQRLYEAGLFPTAVWPEMFLSTDDVHRFGLQPREHLWICRARHSAPDHYPTRRQLEHELAMEIARRRRLELDPPVRIVRGIQRRLRAFTRRS
jgi:SAM-dependent methyltransferase